jgi:hypothetical protein
VDASSLSIPPSLFWPIWQAVARVGLASNRVIAPSDDPMTCAEIQIRDITAEMTIVGGRVVHERGR